MIQVININKTICTFTRDLKTVFLDFAFFCFLCLILFFLLFINFLFQMLTYASNKFFKFLNIFQVICFIVMCIKQITSTILHKLDL